MSGLDIREIRQKIGVSQKELAKKLGVHWRTVQNWEKNGGITQADYTKLCALLPSAELAEQVHYGGEGTEQSNDAPKIVPLIPIRAQGGSLDDFTRSVMAHDCEKVVSPIKGVDFAITVTGDSMSPEYPSGCQILIKKIDPNVYIDWGRVYVLDTANGTIIKKLMPVDEDKSKVRCVSINPGYPPFEVSLEHVFGVYRVMMCMSLK